MDISSGFSGLPARRVKVEKNKPQTVDVRGCYNWAPGANSESAKSTRDNLKLP